MNTNLTSNVQMHGHKHIAKVTRDITLKTSVISQ